VALALPVSTLAKPNPDQADKRAAKAECVTLRGNTDATREAFLTKFRNFGACVTKRAVEEAVEEQNAHTNAAQACKTERGTTTESRDAFNLRYGTNGREGTAGFRRNAFVKCVSEAAKAKEHAADVKDQQAASEWKNAAKECDAARGDTAESRAAFGTTWAGTRTRSASASRIRPRRTTKRRRPLPSRKAVSRKYWRCTDAPPGGKARGPYGDPSPLSGACSTLGSPIPSSSS